MKSGGHGRTFHLAGVFSVLLLLALPRPAGAGVFHWTDDAGVAHFTDDPARVPEAYRTQAVEASRREAAPVIEETAEGEVPADPPAAPPEEAEETASDDGEEEPSPLQQAVDRTGADLDNFGHDKQYWQDRKRFWEHRLETSRTLLEETRREFNLVNQRYDKHEYKKMKALRERMRELEADIAQAEAMLDGGLAKDARRAGAQPGWIR